jgi:murein DD-endopeptidase MepM/ murein hydrolase activator NlpD
MGKQREHPHPAPKHGTKEAIPDEMGMWFYQRAYDPPSKETWISPMKVPMMVHADFDSPRRASNGTTYVHGAIDGIPETPTNEPVEIIASIGGRVLYAGNWDADSGYVVLIGGNDGRIHSYAHLKKDSIGLEAGQNVAQGDTLGVMGKSGNASEMACLHYKIRESIDAVASVSGKDAPVTRQSSADSPSLRHYAFARPMMDGAELRMGMVVQPGSRPSIKQQLAAAIREETAASLRQLTSLNPIVSPTDIDPPSVSRIVFEHGSSSSLRTKR